jgi:hypothetical protein
MAALVAALLLVGTARAEQAGPAAPAPVPQIHKMTIYNGPVPMVSYSVEGGSPHLEALCQTLQFTENELNLSTELQRLRLGIVVNEQTLDAIRTSQALGFGPISTPGYANCYAPPDSALKRSLIPGLAREATPAMAYELINLREQVQTELQAEQAKAAGWVGGKPPATPNTQPVAPAPVPQAQAPAARPAARQVTLSAPTVPQQQPRTLDQQVSSIQRTVRQNQDTLRQQITRMQQQIAQRLQGTLQQHQLQMMAVAQ